MANSKDPGTDLITIGDNSPLTVLQMDRAELDELLSEALAPGERVTAGDLPRVKVPSGGGEFWSIPTPEGTKAEKTLSGVILRRDVRRAYWVKSFEEAPDEQPDCYSDDGIQGHANTEAGPGTLCEECPLNEFGEDAQGNPTAKPCKETRQLFLLQPDALLPIAVSIPPASLQAFKAYSLGLLNARLRPIGVITHMELETAKNNQGVNYSRVTFRAGDRLDKAAIDALKSYAALMAPQMDRAAEAEAREERKEAAASS